MALTLRVLSRALLASFIAMAGVAEAASFLPSTESVERVSRELVARQLFTELTALLGHGASHERLARLEAVMRPMYRALPKNEDGGIDQGVARYALNRYFLTYHAWNIVGIAPDGERGNASSSTTMLKSKMPSFIFELLEERVGRKRLGLGELAVLAATVEDLVHGEGLGLLQSAYTVHNLSMDEPLEREEEADLVIKTFMLFFTMPWTRKAQNNASMVHSYLETAHEDNAAWKDSMLWMEDVKQTVKFQDRSEHNPFSSGKAYFGDYPSMAHLAERIIDGYGLFQDIQCKELKHTLMELEEPERSDGRVLLAKFYRPYMQGVHDFFVERPGYLKHLGSLDETNPDRLSVVVPNYIYGRQFCIAVPNTFQSFCCVDQCNALMESLEQSIAHPVASPRLIAEVVAALPSDTVAAPRNLSGSLRRKLDMIAEKHGGLVPLHSRLFAQFMHHAFPNECPQPRAPGAEAQMSHAQWRASQNTSSVVRKKVAHHLAIMAADANEPPAGEEENSMLWTEEEELITSVDIERLGSPGAEQEPGGESRLRRTLRAIAMSGAAVSVIAVLFDSLPSSASLLRLKGAKGACARAGDLPRREAPAGKSLFV